MGRLLDHAAAELRVKLAAARTDLRSQIDGAATRLNAQIGRLAIQGLAWLIAGILAVVAIGFATLAGYRALLAHFLPEEAAAMVAGVYAALALFAALAALSAGAPARPAGAAPAAVEPQPARASSEEPPSLPAAAEPGGAAAEPRKLDLAQIADLLGKVGLAREQAALLVAGDVAKSLSPMQLVAAGLVAGFVAGRKLDT